MLWTVFLFETDLFDCDKLMEQNAVELIQQLPEMDELGLCKFGVFLSFFYHWFKTEIDYVNVANQLIMESVASMRNLLEALKVYHISDSLQIDRVSHLFIS